LPVAVLGLSNVVGLAAGHGHACARLMNGTARCWGYSNDGETGDGTSAAARPIPTPVRGLPDPVQCSATPGAPVAEVCGDGIDNDCDGVVDNGC
jgi:hypothetical protein